nr:4-amino-4-deoxy-L-arabinose-phosphoundecaprenol flippase subunit ArnF [Pseudomonas aeruginosa]
MTGLGQVAQKLTVEHWRLVAADGWTARLRSPWPWLALLALGLGLLCWLLLLQRVEVGSAYPMLALNFVLVTLAARFVFDEPVDRRHLAGLLLIVAGVALLGRSACRAAVAAYAASLLCWLAALRHLPLGRAYSLLSASYALVYLLAASLPAFDETFSTSKTLGVGLVVLGVLTVNARRTAAAPAHHPSRKAP